MKLLHLLEIVCCLNNHNKTQLKDAFACHTTAFTSYTHILAADFCVNFDTP